MLARYLFHNLHRLAGTVTLRSRTANNGSGKHVETFDTTRSCGIGSITQRGQRNHCAVGGLYKEQVNVLLMLTIRSFRLDIHLIYTVEHIEVVYIYGTCIGFHRGEHIRQRHTQHLHLVTVHIKIELRNLGLQRRRKSRQVLMLLRIIHQRIRCLYQIVKGSLTASFELHFKTAGCSQSRNHRRSGKIDFTFGIFRQVLFHLLHYFVNGSILAVFPRFQDNGQFTACLIASYTRAATRYVLHISHIRVLFQILHRTIGHYTGTLQCSAFRQFQLHLKVSLVFGRQEAGRYQTVNNEDSD